MEKIGFKFEKLIIWQKAMDFGENVFKLTKDFPKEELYSLTSQLRRAVDSDALILRKVQQDSHPLNIENLLDIQ